MANETENINSTNDEVESSDTLNEEETLNLDDIDDIDRAKELLAEKDKQNKQLFQRAKKAEEKLKESKTKVEETKVETQPSQPEPKIDVVDKKVREILEERDLDSVDISDGDKKELKAFAKATGISIKEALKSDFYNFKKEKFDATKKAEEASISGGGGSPRRQEFDINNPPKCDMATEEGRKTWDAFAEWRKGK